MKAEFPLHKELGSPQLNTAQKVFVLILVTVFFQENAKSYHQHMKNKEISISPTEFKMLLHLPQCGKHTSPKSSLLTMLFGLFVCLKLSGIWLKYIIKSVDKC